VRERDGDGAATHHTCHGDEVAGLGARLERFLARNAKELDAHAARVGRVVGVDRIAWNEEIPVAG